MPQKTQVFPSNQKPTREVLKKPDLAASRAQRINYSMKQTTENNISRNDQRSDVYWYANKFMRKA